MVPLRRSIRVKLMLLVLSIMIPFISFFAYLTFRQYKDSVDEQLNNNVELAGAFSMSFVNFLEQIWLTELSIGQSLLDNESWDLSEKENYLESILAKEGVIDGLTWLDPEGNVLLTTQPSLYLKNFRERQYVRRIRDGEEKVLSPLVMSKADNGAIIPIARGIYQGDQLMGIMVAILDDDKVGTVFKSMKLRSSARFGLVDPTGTLVYRSGLDTVPEDKRKISDTSPTWRALRGELVLTQSRNSSFDGSARFGVDYPIPEIGWACYITVSLNELLTETRSKALKDILILSAVTAGALLAAAYLFGRTIVNPVMQLFYTAKRYGGGDLEARVPDLGMDELGSTGRAFNHMLEQIRSQVQEIEEEKGTIRAILDSLPVGVIIADANGRIVETNRQFIEICAGAPASPILKIQDYGQFQASWTDTGEKLDPEDWALAKAIRFGETTVGEVLDLVRFDGETATIMNSAAPIIGSGGQILGAVVAIMDITDRRALETRLEVMVAERTKSLVQLHGQLHEEALEKSRMQQEINRMDRLNSIGQLAAGIGHEIRNPMTTIRGFLQLLSRKEQYLKERPYFDIMIEELDRANGILTEFLGMARYKPMQLEPGDLNEIIRPVYPLIEAEANLSSHQVILDLQPVPLLPLDEKEIRQLLLNLCRNALEAMASPGSVTIRTRHQDGKVMLSVQDEGHGMPPEVIEKLGKPFFTTKEGGTGLGLGICYDIASRHHAELTVDSSPKGTLFTISFQV